MYGSNSSDDDNQNRFMQTRFNGFLVTKTITAWSSTMTIQIVAWSTIMRQNDHF